MKAEYEGISFERPGHATVRIVAEDGTVLYIDPWSEVIDCDPGDADVVFVTHDDRDHYDPAAIQAVSSDRTVVAAYEAIETADLNQDVTPLPATGETTVAGITVQLVPAYNRPDGEHVRESGEPFHDEGEVNGLHLTIDGVTIYYPSDTDFLDAHRDIEADVVLPPIGGSYTMDRHEAAEMIEEIGPELVLPVHYNTEAVPGLDSDAEAFKNEVETADTQVVLI